MVGTTSSRSGRNNAITPAFCSVSMFCGLVANSATVCTNDTLVKAVDSVLVPDLLANENYENTSPSSQVSLDAKENDSMSVLKIKRIADTSSSHTNCANNLLLALFSIDELKKDANINGKSANGGPPKDKLDEEKVEIIRKYCLDRLPPGTTAESG